MTHANQPKPSPMVILHVFPSFGFGGQQARFAALANGLVDDFSHVVVALDGDMSAKTLISEKVTIQYKDLIARKSSGVSLPNLIKLRKLIRDSRPNLLCTYNWGSLEAAIANRLGGLGAKIPHIHFEDGFGPDESLTQQKSKRVLARRILLSKSTIIVPSKTLEDLALNIWKLPKGSVIRVSNGVDYDRFQKAAPQIKSHILVGSVGALRPEKNYARLIRSFEAADRRKKAMLQIIGEGPERGALLDVIGEGKGEPRINLPGATASPEKSYSAFDIFALSSDTEQAPLSLIEAMAAGLPVLSTNVGDVASMVSTENRAFITPLGDEEAYTTALTHLLDNPDARATLGAANRRKAKEEFSSERMIEQYRALFISKVAAHD